MKKYFSLFISGSMLLAFVPFSSFAAQSIELWDPEVGFSRLSNIEISRVVERREEREIISTFWNLKKGITPQSSLPSLSPRQNKLYSSDKNVINDPALATFWKMKKGFDGTVRKSRRIIEMEAHANREARS